MGKLEELERRVLFLEDMLIRLGVDPMEKMRPASISDIRLAMNHAKDLNIPVDKIFIKSISPLSEWSTVDGLNIDVLTSVNCPENTIILMANGNKVGEYRYASND